MPSGSFADILRMKSQITVITEITETGTLEEAIQATVDTMGEALLESVNVNFANTEESIMTKVKDLLAPLDLSQFPTTEFVQNLVSQLGLQIGAQLTAITNRLNALVAKAASYALVTIDQSTVLPPTVELPFLHAIVQHNLNSAEVAIEFFDNDGDAQLLPIVKRNADSVVINMSTVDPVADGESYKLIVIGGYSEVGPDVEDPALQGLAPNQLQLADGTVIELRSNGELGAIDAQGQFAVWANTAFNEMLYHEGQINAWDGALAYVRFFAPLNSEPLALESIPQGQYEAHKAQASRVAVRPSA
jgi:hypothetical protein